MKNEENSVFKRIIFKFCFSTEMKKLESNVSEKICMNDFPIGLRSKRLIKKMTN